MKNIRTTYRETRKIIRTNGVFHARKWALLTGDALAVRVCDALLEVDGTIDHLADRARFARHDPGSVSFLLTFDGATARRYR